MQTKTEITPAAAPDYEIFAAMTGAMNAEEQKAMIVARLMLAFGVSDELTVKTWLNGLGSIDALEPVMVVGRGETGYVYATPPNADHKVGFFKDSLKMAAAYFEGAEANMG